MEVEEIFEVENLRDVIRGLTAQVKASSKNDLELPIPKKVKFNTCNAAEEEAAYQHQVNKTDSESSSDSE